MVTDQQVRQLMKLNKKNQKLSVSAAQSGMCENTARKYLQSGKLPSQTKVERTWQTHDNVFKDVWDEMQDFLSTNPGLEAKTLFEYLQKQNPGRFPDGQLRTFQRRVKQWRATEGPGKEVFFRQQHYPGQLCASDFTHLSSLGITIAGQPFEHLLYHFVLTYSNWETGTICFSESFESLSAGLQNALWEVGGVPTNHRTDRLSSAVNKIDNPEEFTRAYSALLRHYGLKGQKIQAGKANENGTIEQRHYRFKRAIEQSLLLRGSKDFASRDEYALFLSRLFEQLNSNRQERFLEELPLLKSLPHKRLNDFTRFDLRVSSGSTIRVSENIYSVHSRLIGERVIIRQYADNIEVWYAQKCITILPRLRGRKKHKIDYRHIIDWLVRKPGAFENYLYRNDLFPTSRFRMVYDSLCSTNPGRCTKEYLNILYLAARESECCVDAALQKLLDKNQPISFAAVQLLVESIDDTSKIPDIQIADINLKLYDSHLLQQVVSV